MARRLPFGWAPTTINESDVLDALRELEPQIRQGTFNLNEPISVGRYYGYPPLAAAARECNLNLVEVILKQKSVDPCTRDNRIHDAFRHRTVLMHALSGALDHSNTACLRLLLADPRVQATINETSPTRRQPTTQFNVLDMALQAKRRGWPFASVVVDLLIESGGIVAAVSNE
jgi:hypothetical protein